MKTLIRPWLIVGLLSAMTLPTQAYTAADLLTPCVEGDNDSRWGEVAILECEQYIKGYLDALEHLDQNPTFCLPEQNRDTDVRWAFMKWVYADFERRKLPAREAMKKTLEQGYPCSNVQ